MILRTTLGPWLVSEFDGTTVYSGAQHTGVAACAPDPLSPPNIQGGHHFAPPQSFEERQANARMTAASLTLYHATGALLAGMATIRPSSWSPQIERAVTNAGEARRYAEIGSGPAPWANRASIEQIRAKVRLVAQDKSLFGQLSTGEKIAVGLVLGDVSMICDYGSILEAVARLGQNWIEAALYVQRNGWSEEVP